MVPTHVLRVIAVWILVAPAAAWAQKPPQQAGGPEKQTLALQGVLQGLQPGLLQVVNEGGESWLLKVEARADAVTYHASAEPAWLQPGMYVQFKGTFNKHGRATAPVSQVTVFTPNQMTQLGAFPDAAPGSAGGELFGEGKPEPKAKPKPKTQPETLALTVAGRLAGIEDGKMRVAAGSAVVEAALADDASISVELNNYALARPGDKVSVNGWYYQKGQGWANQLIVRAAQPLAGAKKERVVVSPEERKKAFDALEDLSAGEATAKPQKAPMDKEETQLATPEQEPPKKE